MEASTKLLHGKEHVRWSALDGATRKRKKTQTFWITEKVGSDVVLTLYSLLLDDYLSQTELSDEQIAALNQRLLPVVRVLESR